MKIVKAAPDNPEFARVVDVRGLASAGDAFDLRPDPEEAEALARLLDVRSVRKMRFTGVLRAVGEALVLEGTLGATVVQSCVVTLDPVSTRIDVPVRRVFRPDLGQAVTREVEVGLDEDDDVEPLSSMLDLGRVAVEALALTLPPYPRRDGASLPAETELEDEDEAERPFAALSALRDRLDGT
jgi:uncharacterized metal-binding protein YceD (DUF177 family)